MKRSVLILALFLWGSVSVSAGTYRAKPNGTGDGISVPMSISSFWGVAKPGDKLLLEDGTYTGQSNMILPPSGLAGIIIEAVNDGRVLIDGQGINRTCRLTSNDNFSISGINACRAFGTSTDSASVFHINRSNN